ncbi:MAG: metallophosphoesterase [Polyangiaceae bacterium]|nr:metallophosphoesterase [Polyangiaceae bacterium]
MQLKHVTLVLAVGLVLAGGCVRASQERAERDLEVGKHSAHGLSIDVTQGLAAVRHVAPGELTLWSSAPAWTVTLTTAASAPTSWRVSVQNAMPDAELTGPVPVHLVSHQPVTRKEFQIELSAGSTTTLTLAPPDRDDPSAWRFAVMSDVQEAIDEVQDIYQKVNQTPNVRFLLGAGDLTQQGGAEQLERFQRELESLDVPYYTTLGNHELGDDGPAYQDWFGRASFSFVYRRVRFSMLDSASATLDPLVYDWLDDWLAAGASGVHVVAMHVPPVDPVGVRNGSFASRNEAAKLLTRLAKGKVDLTLYGHIHSYYSFDNAGIPAYVSGGGGAIPERFDQIGRHFLIVDVDPARGVDQVKMVQVD